MSLIAEGAGSSKGRGTLSPVQRGSNLYGTSARTPRQSRAGTRARSGKAMSRPTNGISSRLARARVGATPPLCKGIRQRSSMRSPSSRLQIPGPIPGHSRSTGVIRKSAVRYDGSGPETPAWSSRIEPEHPPMAFSARGLRSSRGIWYMSPRARSPRRLDRGNRCVGLRGRRPARRKPRTPITTKSRPVLAMARDPVRRPGRRQNAQLAQGLGPCRAAAKLPTDVASASGSPPRSQGKRTLPVKSIRHRSRRDLPRRRKTRGKATMRARAHSRRAAIHQAGSSNRRSEPPAPSSAL